MLCEGSSEHTSKFGPSSKSSMNLVSHRFRLGNWIYIKIHRLGSLESRWKGPYIFFLLMMPMAIMVDDISNWDHYTNTRSPIPSQSRKTIKVKMGKGQWTQTIPSNSNTVQAVIWILLIIIPIHIWGARSPHAPWNQTSTINNTDIAHSSISTETWLSDFYVDHYKLEGEC